MITLLNNETHTIKVAGSLPDKSYTERQWRDSELLRTDALVMLPDYPQDLTVYRQQLRDYPSQPDFPNGQRPTI